MTTYAFIPARGGSTRIPDKNLQEGPWVKPFQRITLVRAAVLLGEDACDGVVVSTDSDRIKDHVAPTAASLYSTVGVHNRPDQLAGPHAQIEDAIIHWGRRADLDDSDTICLLQPTSPFRRVETIRRCVEAVASGEHESAVAVIMDGREAFRGRKVMTNNVGLWERPRGWKRPRSQDVRKRPEETGSVYAFTWGFLKRTGQRMGDGSYCVEVDRYEALDIDTPEDLELARVLAPHVERLRGLL